MAEFKKGDRVVVSGQFPPNHNGVGVIENVSASCCGVRLDAGRYIIAHPKHILYYVEVEMQATPIPPQKIQQNGYEYELVGTVKPDWLIDRAWVVNVLNGEKRKVIKSGENYNLHVNDIVSIRYHDGLKAQYRPHTPEDYKWGDLAMYEGKRVFVMGSLNEDKYIEISKPPIHNKVLDGWDYIHASELTPTF